MTKRLIINADDLGMSPGVNRGILEAHQRGIVNSTTAMVNLPDAGDGIRLLQQQAPEMRIGLHLNFTHGRPLVPMPSLVTGSGDFPPMESIIHLTADVSADELAAEVTAQFDRFVELAGTLPDHIDSHHHMAFFFPGSLRRTLELAYEHNLPLRYPDAFVDAERIRLYVQNALDEAAARQLAQALAAVCADFPHFRAPNYIELGFRDDLSQDELAALFAHLPDSISELVCHPGYVDARNDSFNERRERELSLLTDPATRALLDQAGIERITFGGLPA